MDYVLVNLGEENGHGKGRNETERLCLLTARNGPSAQH